MYSFFKDLCETLADVIIYKTSDQQNKTKLTHTHTCVCALWGGEASENSGETDLIINTSRVLRSSKQHKLKHHGERGDKETEPDAPGNSQHGWRNHLHGSHSLAARHPGPKFCALTWLPSRVSYDNKLPKLRNWVVKLWGMNDVTL